MAVRVVTDSTADLPKDQAEELGIHVIPLLVQFGDDVFRDGVDLDTVSFYEKLEASRVSPTTATLPAAKFEEAYRQLIEEGADGILAIYISSTMSGTYNSGLLAAQNMKDSGTPIEVLDSRWVSAGMGIPVLEAARAAKAGKSLAECKAVAEDVMARMNIFAVVETLEYLQRGGRIGKARQLVGTLLNVKPILAVRDGVVQPLEQVRTRSKAYERMAQLLANLGPLEVVGIAESNEELGQQLTRAIETVYSGPIQHFRLGPAVGTHAGPGTAALCAVTKRKE